ncbi:MAG: shikimate dehydrogenase [Candidatus Levybacteria bacterium]|nr:shikimate dehydrogenase [Candidatus Levybacteria bacterium]
MNINAKTKLCCIIGDPVEHSLSPIMHNAGYQALGLNFAFVAFHVKDVKKAIEGLRALNVRGIVVTVPHKIEVLKYVDNTDETAKKIGAANTIVNDNGMLTASNTDWTGSLEALRKVTSIAGKTVVVLGAGGAARAVVYGLKKEGAIVNVCNRTIQNAEELVEEFDLNGAYTLDNKEIIIKADIIINTTSVGMEPKQDETPIPVEYLQSHHIVYDIVYVPKETELLKAAKNLGAKVVYGDKMLFYGAIPQFELFTQNKAPIKEMEKALDLEIERKKNNA